MKKRIVSFLLCLCMLISILPIMASAATEAPTPAFLDVKEDAYYYEAVNWAVKNGVTNGTSRTTFSPDERCTNGEFITFLWRAAGGTEYKQGYGNEQINEYYYDASSWASEKGIYGDRAFIPNNALCSRSSAVQYLWNFAGSPLTAQVPFSDVEGTNTLAKAVSWAIREGITNGSGDGVFLAYPTCTRAEAVTFIYRYFVSPLDNRELMEELTNAYNGSCIEEDLSEYGLTLTPAEELSDVALLTQFGEIHQIIAGIYSTYSNLSDELVKREFELWSEIDRRGLFDE